MIVGQLEEASADIKRPAAREGRRPNRRENAAVEEHRRLGRGLVRAAYVAAPVKQDPSRLRVHGPKISEGDVVQGRVPGRAVLFKNAVALVEERARAIVGVNAVVGLIQPKAVVDKEGIVGRIKGRAGPKHRAKIGDGAILQIVESAPGDGEGGVAGHRERAINHARKPVESAADGVVSRQSRAVERQVGNDAVGLEGRSQHHRPAVQSKAGGNVGQDRQRAAAQQFQSALAGDGGEGVQGQIARIEADSRAGGGVVRAAQRAAVVDAEDQFAAGRVHDAVVEKRRHGEITGTVGGGILLDERAVVDKEGGRVVIERAALHDPDIVVGDKSVLRVQFAAGQEHLARVDQGQVVEVHIAVIWVATEGQDARGTDRHLSRDVA